MTNLLADRQAANRHRFGPRTTGGQRWRGGVFWVVGGWVLRAGGLETVCHAHTPTFPPQLDSADAGIASSDPQPCGTKL